MPGSQWHGEASEPATRRDRVRAATTAEIKTAARRLLVDSGPEAMTLRAIARQMGMTAPAIYRYFASYDDLRTAVAGDLLGELLQAVVLDGPAPADVDPVELAIGKARAFRRWAVEHPAEFALTFAQPPPDHDHGPDDPCTELAGKQQFGGAFFQLFARIWAATPFEVLPEDRIDPRLVPGLRRWGDENGGPDVPVGALFVFLTLWVRLYGLVALEVFGHLSFALDDAEAFFEMTMRDLVDRLRTGRTP